MDDVIKSILEKISFQDDCNLVCDDSDEVISRLDKKNLYEIKKSKPLKSIVFIDGGNLELIRSPSLSVFFSRVVYIKYKDNKKTSSKRIEFYSVFHAK